MKPIKTSEINTFKRVGIDFETLQNYPDQMTVMNRFSGETAKTSALVACVIQKVYNVSNAYERGDYSVKTSDFDRLRMFVLNQDSKAYMTCLD